MPKFPQKAKAGLAVAALACSIAVFGCSTNRTPGDGEPGMSGPASSPASTPGTSSGTPVSPPMASAMSIDHDGPAAIMAAHQRERFLGYINPTGPQQTSLSQTQPTGQLVPPSMYANPESTVNASISSAPTPVIADGGGIDDAAIFPGIPGGPTGTTAVTAPGATAGTTAATANNALLTPTTAALGATPGVAPSTAAATTAPTPAATFTNPSNGTLTPTMSSSAIPSPNMAANGTPATAARNATPVAPMAANTGTPAMSSAAPQSATLAVTPSSGSLRSPGVSNGMTATPATTRRRAATLTAGSTTAAAGGAPVRVVTANGTLVITNIASPPPAPVKNQ